MTSPQAVRILVCGHVSGKLKPLFTRLNAVNRKSGPFDMVLVVGCLFGDTDQDNHDWIEFMDSASMSSLPLPSMPIYILGPTNETQARCYRLSPLNPDPDFNEGFDLVDGIMYLGRRGVLTGASGIKIAYLSGREKATGSSCPYSFSDDDFTNLLQQTQMSSNSVDILMTFQWPKDVYKFLSMESYPKELINHTDECGSDTLSKLAQLVKPRYHFVPGTDGLHVERQPYRNHVVLAEAAKPVTRFISLGGVGNKTKSKWLYAFNITPSQLMNRAELIKQPDDVTECPYAPLSSKKTEAAQQQYFYDTTYTGEGNDGYQQKRHRGNTEKGWKNRREERPQQPCWFCLESPEVEKHLIISIGDACYTALAKGGLVEEHILIIPINHYRSTLDVSENMEVREEIEKFKSALIDYFAATKRVPVFFERNYRTQHLQIQVVPVAIDKAMFIRETIDDLAEQADHKFNDLPDNVHLHDMLDAGSPYFYLEAPSVKLKLFTRIKAGSKFPLQFGREILADQRILDIPQKIDWRVSVLNKEESTIVATKFRKNFATYDFTL